MTKIKRFKEYSESISGTELIGTHMGPGYGTPEFPTTMGKNDTEVFYSELNGKIYTYDEYQEIYQEYLTIGVKPLPELSSETLDMMLDKIQKSKNE